MRVHIETKLPKVGTTIFTVMSQLAQQSGAINLSQGFPDFDPPEGLIAAFEKHMRSGSNQYAPMTGAPALRAEIAAKVNRVYGARVSPDTEVTVTSGATEALYAAMAAVLRRGDKVLLFDPAYDAYEPAAELQGATTLRLPLTAPDFRIDWEAVAEILSAQDVRLIVLNSPHNPTGAVLDGHDLDQLEKLLDGSETLVLSDEVYEHMVFDDMTHHSMLTRPALAARSFVVSSFGKTYHATGWKIGYCIAPQPLTDEFRKVHQYLTFCTITPAQLAYADFMGAHPEFADSLVEFYSAKRDRFCAALDQTRFKFEPAKGTYFQLADYSEISDELDMEFVHRLTTQHGVAAIPISVFYDSPPEQNLIRFCFAKDDATLDQAGEMLCRI